MIRRNNENANFRSPTSSRMASSQTTAPVRAHARAHAHAYPSTETAPSAIASFAATNPQQISSISTIPTMDQLRSASSTFYGFSTAYSDLGSPVFGTDLNAAGPYASLPFEHVDTADSHLLVASRHRPSVDGGGIRNAEFSGSSSPTHRNAFTEAWDRLSAAQAAGWTAPGNLGFYSAHLGNGHHTLFDANAFANTHDYLALAAAQQSFRHQVIRQRANASPHMYGFDSHTFNEPAISRCPYRKRKRELIDPSIPIKERKVKGIVTMCCICFENEVSHVLYPCGHPCLCLDCSSIGLKECPVCRTRNIRPMKFFGTLIEDVEEIKNEIESNETSVEDKK